MMMKKMEKKYGFVLNLSGTMYELYFLGYKTIIKQQHICEA